MGPKKRAGKSKPKPNPNSGVADYSRNLVPMRNPNSDVGDSAMNLEQMPDPNSGVADSLMNLEPMRNPNSDVGDSSMNLEPMPDTSSDLSLKNFEPTPNPEKKSELGECSSNLERKNESDEVLSVIKQDLDYVFDVDKFVVSAYLRTHLEENEDMFCKLIEGLKDEKSSILVTIEENRKEYRMRLEHFNGRRICFEEKSKNLLKVIQPIELLLDTSERNNEALKVEYDALRFEVASYEQKGLDIIHKLGRKIDDQDIELLTRLTNFSDEALKFLFQAAKNLRLTSHSDYKLEIKIRAQVIRGHLQRVANEVEKMVTSLTDQKGKNEQLEMKLKDALAISRKALRSFKKCCLALGCTVHDFGFDGEGKFVELQHIVLHLDAIETSFKKKDQIIQEMKQRIETSQVERLRKNSFFTIVAVAATALATAFLSA